MENNKPSYDKRTFQRYVDKGLIKDGELKSHFSALPDESNNAQWVQIDLHDAELSDGMGEESGDGAA